MQTAKEIRLLTFKSEQFCDQKQEIAFDSLAHSGHFNASLSVKVLPRRTPSEGNRRPLKHRGAE